MRPILAALAALTLAACGTSEPAQPEPTESAQAFAGVPPEIAEQIRAAGQSMDPSSMNLFADLVAAPPYDDVSIAKDVSYDDAERNVLDIYTANDAEEGSIRPILLFVHGGGFVQGDKSGDFYPDNVGAWAARNGMVGINMNYRLAPDNAWPAGRDDIASVLRWIRQNATEFGGDPGQVILFGHSAGANHVADYVGHADRQSAEQASVQGAVLLSPAYMAEAPEEPNPYYGTDADLTTAAPAIERLGASRVPIFLAYAEFDPDMFQDFARTAQTRMCEGEVQRNCPTVLRLADHNHFTEGASIGSTDQSLTGPLKEWIEEQVG